MQTTTKTATPTAHIWLDERGCGWIDDTNSKVIEVALDKLGSGWTVDEIYEGHDHYLSLAQIHAAFVGYYENQAEYDAEIERHDQEYDALRAESRINDPSRAKLRAIGKIP